MSNNWWMSDEQQSDWNSAKDETKEYISERVRDGFIEPQTIIDSSQGADWVQANNRYAALNGSNYRTRLRKADGKNLRGEDIANIDATIAELNRLADEQLELRGYSKSDGVWYDSFGRECNDRGERY